MQATSSPISRQLSAHHSFTPSIQEGQCRLLVSSHDSGGGGLSLRSRVGSRDSLSSVFSISSDGASPSHTTVVDLSVRIGRLVAKVPHTNQETVCSVVSMLGNSNDQQIFERLIKFTDGMKQRGNPYHSMIQQLLTHKEGQGFSDGGDITEFFRVVCQLQSGNLFEDYRLEENSDTFPLMLNALIRLNNAQVVMKDNLTDKTAQIQEMMGRLSKREALIKDMRATQEDMTREKEELQGQVESLASEKEELQGQVESLAREKEELQGQVESLASEKEELQGQVEKSLASEKANIETKCNEWLIIFMLVVLAFFTSGDSNITEQK